MKEILVQVILIFILLLSFLLGNNGDVFEIDCTLGGPKLKVDPKHDGLKYTQLIIIDSEKIAKDVITFLSEFLLEADLKLHIKGIEGVEIPLVNIIGEFLSFDYEQRTAYVMISPMTDRCILHEPEEGPNQNAIWFRTEEINPEPYAFVSMYLFVLLKNTNFRTVLYYDDGRYFTFGKYSILPERFKKGIRYEGIHKSIKVVGFGEMFFDSIYVLTEKGEDAGGGSGFINYLDSLQIGIGSRVGIRFEVLGTDSTECRDYTFKIIHPPYGFGPDEGETLYVWDENFCPLKPALMGWKFAYDYEVLPGEWKFQIYEEGALLFEKNFSFSKREKLIAE